MSKNNPDSEHLLCRWCEEPLNSLDSLEKSVCLSCYRQLVKAGFSDEEIFDREVAGVTVA